MNATRTATRAPLRDLLVAMAEDALEERRPWWHCDDCKPGIPCDDHASDLAMADQYNTVRLQVAATGADTEVLALLPRLAALLAGTGRRDG